MSLCPLVAGTFAAEALAVAVLPVMAYTGQQHAGVAKTSMQQAQAVPGWHITDRELERERGGSGMRYFFDVKTHGKTRKIGVDTKTGKLLENSAQGTNPGEAE